jgi:DNA polymerase
LKVLANHYDLGEKGTEVENALGLRRQDFSPEQLARYGEYCKNDVSLTYALFNAMAKDFPPTELRLIDLTVRMFTDPVLRLDKNMLVDHLLWEKQRKDELLENFAKDDLMSNNKFADILVAYGIAPPMKTSPTTGKQTYAFSKTDEAFKALLEHGNPQIQALVGARLGTKSTIEETRTARFIGIAERGALPVPLRYYAAHTGRWGGDDKLNLQNLQRNSPLKKCILAPDGYTMIDSDSSQIEARTLAWQRMKGSSERQLSSAVATGWVRPNSNFSLKISGYRLSLRRRKGLLTRTAPRTRKLLNYGNLLRHRSKRYFRISKQHSDAVVS